MPRKPSKWLTIRKDNFSYEDVELGDEVIFRALNHTRKLIRHGTIQDIFPDYVFVLVGPKRYIVAYDRLHTVKRLREKPKEEAEAS